MACLREGEVGRGGDGEEEKGREMVEGEEMWRSLNHLCMPLNLLAAIQSICISVGHFCVVISSVAFIYKPILILTRFGIRQIVTQKKCVILTCLSSEIQKKRRNLMG